MTHDKLEVRNQLLKWRLVGLDIFFLPFVIATSLSFANLPSQSIVSSHPSVLSSVKKPTSSHHSYLS